MNHLTRWHPLRELSSLLHQMNCTLDAAWHHQDPSELLPIDQTATWSPDVELQETSTAFRLKVAVPGIDPQDLDVQVSDTAVSIAGDYQEEKTAEGQGFFHSEFQYGRCYRRIPLPTTVQPEQVTAECKDGLLTLTLPKVEPTRRNTVKVDLGVQAKARETMTAERQSESHLRETMRSRSEAAMAIPKPNGIQAEAREEMVADRQAESHLKDTMLERTMSQVGQASQPNA